jgi:hypothetical protein
MLVHDRLVDHAASRRRVQELVLPQAVVVVPSVPVEAGLAVIVGL